MCASVYICICNMWLHVYTLFFLLFLFFFWGGGDKRTRTTRSPTRPIEQYPKNPESEGERTSAEATDFTTSLEDFGPRGRTMHRATCPSSYTDGEARKVALQSIGAISEARPIATNKRNEANTQSKWAQNQSAAFSIHIKSNQRVTPSSPAMRRRAL